MSRIQKNIFSVMIVAAGLLFLMGTAFKVTYSRTDAGNEAVPSGQKVEENDSVEDVITQGEQYLYREAGEESELILYDREGEIVLSETYPEAVRYRLYIDEVTENILSIRLSVGSPAAYEYYFDKESAKVSETFFNPRLVGDSYVAYMEENELILRDIFDENLLCMRIIRDFTQTADPMSAIISIEMADSENIILTYYKGENYIETSEKIEID